MASEVIDFAELALSRLAQQYRDKPKYVQLVQELAGLVQSEIDDPLEYLITLYDINTAEGHNLDVIGEIVGQPRVIVDYDLFVFFGYDGSTGSGTYGDLNDSNIGARYLSSGEDIGGDKTLSDAEYRVFILARILRNYSKSTPEDIIESAKLILNTESIRYTEGVMSFDLGVLGPVDVNYLELISSYDILPRPTGVSISSVYIIPATLIVTGTSTIADNAYIKTADVNDFPSYTTNLTLTDDVIIYYVPASTKWVIKIPTSEGGERFEIVSTDYTPPKTGWGVGSLGSPAPTIDY